MLRIVNRVLIGLAGLVLVCLGGGMLAAAAGLAVPSWWPWDGPHDVLLSDADRERWRGEGWWWPVVIALLALLVLLALWHLTAQLRRKRLAEVLVESGDGEGALLRGRALEGVLERESESLDGVARAHIVLTGSRTAPATRVGLLLEPHVSPRETLARLTDEAITHARESAGLESLPTEAHLRAAKHRPRRVS
ncbi:MULTISPECIES: alkaline shock response membrane anchor protein AmaP [unclassified Streptomyces]|uniref:alkaline shock response membrane anchor protein AmaP n=1 Tax=unclassified Streptomyces TaxID=2593676 RepID=UPI00331E90ED